MDQPDPGFVPGKLSQIKSRLLAQIKSGGQSGSIFKNMLVLATGSMMARAIGFAAIPIITRIYTPDHLGVLSVFASFTALISPFGTLRYSSAIPLPKKDGTAVNIFVLSLSILAVISVLAWLLLWLFAPALLRLFSMNEMLPYWWLVVAAVSGAGLYEVLGAWATRERAFRPLAKTAVWQVVLSSLVKIGLGLLGFKPIGLLIGHVVSQAGGCTSLSTSFYQKLKVNMKHVSVRRLYFVAKRYVDFPKFRLPSQFLLAFSVNAPLLFSAMLFGKEITGQLGLALTTLALPIALFGNTTGQAYFAEIAKIGRNNPEQIRQITKSVTKKLFIVSLLPFLMLLLAGPWLFVLVFGKAWRDAGVFASILAVYLLAQFVSTPIINVLTVFEKQWLFLRVNIIRSLLISFVFCLSYFLSLEPFISIFIYSIVLALHYAFVSIIIFKTIR
jgi:O-antigen/teichoic acid export membrane protein